MRVGILTCHAAYNYGSVLQAYALQEAVKKIGYQVEIIDYRPYWYDAHRVFTWDSSRKINIRLLVKNLYHNFCFPLRMIRKAKFERFIRSNMRLSTWRGKDARNIPRDYDAYLIGSDQVWNRDLFGSSWPVYLGRFEGKPGSRKVGYAVSAGDGEEVLGKESWDGPRAFSALSVREETLRGLLSATFSLEVPVVLDPTMLIGRDFWIQRSQERKCPDYVLVYMMYPVAAAFRIAREYAKAHSCRVRIISSGAGFFRCSRIHQDSPDEFLNLFRNARAVVTTSFHGTVFSILFGKLFYFISSSRKGENRQQTLLSQLGLAGRLICGDSKPTWERIDYDHVWRKMNELRSCSMDVLKRSLSEK